MAILHSKVAIQRKVKEEDMNFSQQVNVTAQC